MLLKLEEDAEVAYGAYDKAVRAEDRAQNYVNKVGKEYSTCSINML